MAEADATAFDADVADDMGEDFAAEFEKITGGGEPSKDEDQGEEADKADAEDTTGTDKGADDGKGDGAEKGDPDPEKKDPPSSQAGDGKDPASSEKDAKETQQIDWSKASPEHRAAFEAAQSELDKLRKSDASNKGRVSALSRAQHLTQKLARLQTSGADSKAVQTEFNNYLNSESFKKFKELNPELAEPFEALATTVSKVAGKVADDVSTIANEARDEVLTDQAQVVVESHPDYMDIIGAKSKEQASKFGQWVNSQPRAVKEAVARNGKEVIDGEEVAWVIGLYKQAHNIGTQQQDQGDKTAPGNAGGKANNRPGDNLRNRRRNSAPAVHTKGPGASNGPPNDFEAAFDYEANKRSKAGKR